MEKGSLIISNDVFTQIAGAVATSCFGVKGMAVRSKTDGLVHLLRRESMSKGVKVTANEDGSRHDRAAYYRGQRREHRRHQPLHHQARSPTRSPS